MDQKQIFHTWAPREGYIWTKFAKPALFAHAESAGGRRVYAADIPADMRESNNGKTAFIVDLPGASGVEAGLGLAKIGFRPVPLYNGIHEMKTGGLQSAVDNAPIVNALVDGANTLRYTDIPAKAPPAFLLDADRNVTLPGIESMYDNRWSIDIDDMPDAAYLREQGISSVVIWTDTGIQDDLRPIINRYREAGIDILMNGQSMYETSRFGYIKDKLSDADTPKQPQVSPETKEAVRKFENARFGLLLVVILAAINLIGMFLVNAEPLLWTAPSIMWLTYLWVSEIVGDVLALLLSIAYFVLYVNSHKKRKLMLVALILFGFDALVFYIYAFSYGIAAFTGYSFGYGLVVFSLPVIFLSLLIMGTVAYKKLETVSEADYLTSLDQIDDNLDRGHRGWHMRPRRRVFRLYRGQNYSYRGYNGTGKGGYGGYSGYGGTGKGGYGGFKGGYGGFGG